jgi:hypothetical protein
MMRIAQAFHAKMPMRSDSQDGLLVMVAVVFWL